MNSLVLLILGAVLFLIAYATYGAYLARQWGLDPSRKTPAHELYDGVDYVPANRYVLLGHHFASIAGAGPIAGPIQAAIFGWLPVYLWIVLGSIFVGGVHDFGSLLASIRHRGKSIGEIIEANIGTSGKKLFNIFAWLTLILVVAAFASITAEAFAATPAAGTASVLFIFIAMLFGQLVYRRNAGLAVSTIIGVALIFLSVWIGYRYPFMQFDKTSWQYILLVYIFFASVLPVWLLLQPRDYLNSFLLYAMLIGGAIGIILMHPTLQLSPFKGFTVLTGAGAQYLFPMVFVTVACGACSGFHSLVGSGTTSKQLSSENDARFVGYGAMLIEGFLAIVALISVAYVSKAEGSPAEVFANGVAEFMTSFGVPADFGKVFITLAFTAFALTSLDTATRLARYIFQEYFETEDGKRSLLTDKYVATLITIFVAYLLVTYGYQKIWPIFGSANQLLSALALLALTAWFVRTRRNPVMTFIPMIWMFAVTLSATVLLMKNFYVARNYVLVVLAAALFVLAIILMAVTYTTLKGAKKSEKGTTFKAG
ncbi:carbon starvation CstA family protein [Thermosediminibacter oceani]|uniref:Carbon starvation protein CstA n=1 Tax=Thermosediminibacter oceani (strain ATCC BAA-1034 / DSM 16646 / JW/IW-1228P) TaxID=555079 RepID=D9S065_THEOJ|nr:carbon starvation protein A [Thermosediminibacter oceani]ADL06993.1 carbon starvation protein CstA [Thermosediminibacter oceani DSM 16646]